MIKLFSADKPSTVAEKAKSQFITGSCSTTRPLLRFDFNPDPGQNERVTENSAPRRPLTADDVVRRIAAQCAFISPTGEVGIRLEPAALVRQYATSSAARRHGGDGRERRSPSVL